MSLAATCGWTLVRTVVLCLVAWPVCRVIERCLKSVGDSMQFRLIGCLIVPALFPELLVGYSFRDLALAHPKWAEAICSALLFVRIVPVGTIALLAAPRSEFGAAAIYCRRLAMRATPSLGGESPSSGFWQWMELARCYWHGPIKSTLPALALMSIVAFQEFEMAALMQTISWTDWFVIAQRLGLKRDEMLVLSLWPLLGQLPIMLGVLRWLITSARQPGRVLIEEEGSQPPLSRVTMGLGLLSVAMLLIVGCLVPMGLIGWRTLDGLALLLRQRHQQLSLAREISTSGLIAICAGLTAWNISGWSNRSWARKGDRPIFMGKPQLEAASLHGNLMFVAMKMRQSPARERLRGRMKSLAVNGSLLGLYGSLLLSLGCVGLFQQSWSRPFYDTPIPWVLTLIVWLLPRAAILRLWLQFFRNDESAHVAELMEDGRVRRQLLWRLRDQPRFLAVSLLCYWAYCDLPTAYMLAPSGMASGLVRLYNFMHFGRSASLSAEACVFFGTPVIFVALMALVFRWSKES